MIRRLLILFPVAIVSVAATVSFANHNSEHQVQKAGKPNATRVVTSEIATVVQTNDWTNISGASTKIKVPEGGRALILARFTSEAVCHQPVIDHCAMRILIGNRSAHPASGKDFHIDSRYAGETFESEKGRAFDRARTVVPGTYVVRVQGAGMGDNWLTVDDWSLTVKRAPL
jgi:hypothetical protein